jgi:cytochrome c
MTRGAALALALAAAFAFGAAAQDGGRAPFGFGTPATAEQVRAWDIDVGADGEGLPPGAGTAAQGEPIYAAQCASASAAPLKTVESFWPYAPTLFDFINRAMPFNTPGSLSRDEVYAVSAYILFRANLISRDAEMNARTLPRVRMPNRDGFVPDPRPDVHP